MIITKLVENFEQAVRDNERLGKGEKDYEETKEALLDYVEELVHEIRGERNHE